jgi:iron only hydrogenase large subunit-like protein
MQNVWAIEFLGRGLKTRIAPAGDVALVDSPCIRCGQCSAHCPVGAIYEHDQTKEVWERLQNSDIHSVVQIAPAVRVALGEAFGMQPGELSTKKIYSALRRLGFETVFDTNFAADLTIMEEGTELIKRYVEGKGELPLITSCCPAWVDYMEKYYADMIPNFSTAKSPQQMMGAMIKTYWAKKANVDPAKIFSVSVMPCTAKKYEIGRNKASTSPIFPRKTPTARSVPTPAPALSSEPPAASWKRPSARPTPSLPARSWATSTCCRPAAWRA